jgi:hypothetical protein
MNIEKTQYNPKLRSSHLTTPFEDSNYTNFYQQLTFDEKYEYVELKIESLKQRQESMFAEVDLIDFMTERNHPDEELYKTHHTGFYNSYIPTNELAFDLDEEINYYKSMLIILEKEEKDRKER